MSKPNSRLEDAPDPAENPCIECGGLCCSFKGGRISYVTIDDGQRYDSFFISEAKVDRLTLSDGSPVDMNWYLWEDDGERLIVFDCNHLTEDGLCGVYEDRPEMCRIFECAVLQGDETLDEFTEHFEREDGITDDQIAASSKIRDITDRVKEIIAREAGGNND